MNLNRLADSYDRRKYDVRIHNDLFECRIFWAKVVNSESENILTHYTKHTFWEIEYAMEGRIVIKTEDNPRLCINESEFVLVPPDTYHQVVDADSDGARFILAFSLTDADESIRKRMKNMTVPIPLTATENLRSIVTMLCDLGEAGDPLRQRMDSLLFDCLFLELFRILPPEPAIQPTEGKDKSAQLADAVRRYIHELRGIGVTVSGIAEHFNLSERHLNRLILAQTGKNPKELIYHERMKTIEDLVTATDLSFDEISTLCGFSDEYSMNRFFKRYNHEGTLSTFRKIAK